MSNSINPKLKKVLVIGLGQLGLPVAKYVNDKGFDVYGYDISPKAIDRAEKLQPLFEILIFILSASQPIILMIFLLHKLKVYFQS